MSIFPLMNMIHYEIGRLFFVNMNSGSLFITQKHNSFKIFDRLCSLPLVNNFKCITSHKFGSAITDQVIYSQLSLKPSMSGG